MNTTVPAKTMKIIGAILGWLAVAGQFFLIIQNRSLSIPGTIVQFFSFFTILTNILVALCYSFQLVHSKANRAAYWASPNTQAAVGVYILVVGIVYNIVLRFLWSPTGTQKIIDELLHAVVPAWYLLYWIIFAPKNGLKWRDAIDWLLYPFVYLVYVMIRGAITNMYPYPFLDAYNHGYSKVIISSLVILALFLILSIIFIAVGKKLSIAKVQRV